MSLLSKVLLGIAVVGAIYLGGFYTGRGTGEVQTVEVVREVKGDTKTEIQYKDRIVTVTRTVKPDGTTTETTKTEDKQKATQKEVKTTEHSTDKETVVTASKSDYSVGVREHVDYQSLLPTASELRDRIEVTGGKRIVGDVWLDVGVQPGSHDVSIGVRVDF